ncbi:hypothetical protein BDV96DRAFT_354211 [Lophiotrema nucula]|uniref:Uncharacterized protein n=1 Tax=Lophiotrema nucula TaxID=690887 RepID=A0A6A5YGR2_9PLEO|nr:hypothetical protein BDV96DRAFT_354211 [Lophiotrema nucula]
MAVDDTKDRSKQIGAANDDKNTGLLNATSLRCRNSSSSADLPGYYDSEPSSQPPGYNKDTIRSPYSSQHTRRPSQNPRPQPDTAGASAASIAAILGASSMAEVHAKDKESRVKRSFGKRLKDFFTGEGWNQDGGPDKSSSADLNYFGYRLDGRENQQRVLRR